MKKIIYHILFWTFILLYNFDYFVDGNSVSTSFYYSFFELAIYISEFYINLFILIPFLFNKNNKIAYFLSVFIVLSFFGSLYFVTGLYNELLNENTLRAILSFFLNHIMYFILSYFVWHYNKYIKEKQNRLVAEKQKIETEMLLLKSQISPHFLFNSLNNIYTLSLIKSDDAPKMINSLSKILRYFIYSGSNKNVYLSDEIETIEEYIQLQKMRKIAGHKNISLNIETNISTIKIPPLILITFVENAFKHGSVIDNENGFVNISIQLENERILFKISNSYNTKEESNGIGLQNIKSQLDLTYSNNYTLSIDDKNNIFDVTLIF